MSTTPRTTYIRHGRTASSAASFSPRYRSCAAPTCLLALRSYVWLANRHEASAPRHARVPNVWRPVGASRRGGRPRMRRRDQGGRARLPFLRRAVLGERRHPTPAARGPVSGRGEDVRGLRLAMEGVRRAL